MRTTDQATERFRAESRLRVLTAADAPTAVPDLPRRPAHRVGPAHPDGSIRPDGPVGSDGPAAWMRSAPVPPSFEALRAVVATQGTALAPGRPGMRLLLVIALIAVVAGGVYAWRAQPEPEPLAPPPLVSGSPLPVSASALSPQPGPPQSGSPRSVGGAEVTIHVTGKVHRPGVLTLPAGSRVTDAIQAAGGLRKRAAAGPLNLARRLVDGEQIVVGAPGPVAAPVTADPAAVVLDLNTATPQQLEQLPGVGEVLARRIVEYRDGHGGFRTVEQLREVSGIGERKYAEMKDRVHV
ncbi:ComEA family DNA-binding protein [Streptosporangium sp. NBC_01639]|uniref:helix-hairpin-helix domain-containing protein n=1 Tax=Streptosporangium sp. NBC_01639 TaxID=2975948 RepID=UPI00386E124F|nr:ComEA family DNA-binding protein [Streptosporangium sp. NBC_01639]